MGIFVRQAVSLQSSPVTISPTQAGNCIIAVIMSQAVGVAGNVTSVTLGSSGDIFSTIGGIGSEFSDSNNNFCIASVWFDPICSGGQTSVTVSGTNLNFSEGGIVVFEVSGVAGNLVTMTDASGQVFNTAQDWSVTTVNPTTSPDELWIAAVQTASTISPSNSGGWNISATQEFCAVGYQLSTAIGIPSFTGSQVTAGDAVAGTIFTVYPGVPNIHTSGSVALAPMKVMAFETAPTVTTSGSVALAPMAVQSGEILTVVKETGPIGSYATPGPLSCQPGNTAGNLLVLFAAWDVTNNVNSTAVIPSSSVADSSGNWWRLGADSGNAVPGCRCAIWFCANALAITEWLSFCPQGYTSSFSYLVVEFAGAPANYNPGIDFSVSASGSTETQIILNSPAASGDFVFSMGAAGASVAVAGPGAGYINTGSGSEGTGNPDPVTFLTGEGTFGAGSVTATWQFGTPATSTIPSTSAGSVGPWQQVVRGRAYSTQLHSSSRNSWIWRGRGRSGSSLSSSGSTVTGVSAAACMVGLTQASVVVPQSNANFPVIRVEAALGSTPGDPSQAVLDTSWTDLSARCIAGGGVAGISISRGRQYELSQPESGAMTILMNNVDGALNPANVLSPYYPNVILETPIRVSAFWQGRRYPVGFGYVERWPQTWPELRQWGFSALVATDGVGVASSSNLPSAVQGEISADNPYLCLPFSEQYSTSTTSINGTTKKSRDCDGLIAINTSRLNQKTATYIDGALAAVESGLSLGFEGDSGTGMGTSSYSAVDGSGGRGPGATYGPDANLPVILPVNGDVSFEFWVNLASLDTTSLSPPFGTVPLFAVFGSPYLGGEGSAGLPGYLLNVGVNYFSTGNLMWISDKFLGGTPNPLNTPYATAFPVDSGVPTHVVVTIQNGNVVFWVNGIPLTVVSSRNMSGNPITALTFGQAGWSYGPATSEGSNAIYNYNFAIAFGTLYDYCLPAGRIISHLNSGNTGFFGDSITTRFGRYLAWANLGLLPGGPSVTDAFGLAQAYSTSGTALSDALNTDVLSEGGKWYSIANGNIIMVPRPAVYNQVPSVTFSDNINDIADGAIPYEPSLGFDFDNTYVNNIIQATLVQGANTLIAPIEKDFPSITEYFARGPLSQQVQGTSLQDAYDRANWTLQQYRQPSMRVQQLVVELASKPAAITAVLQTDLADIALVKRAPIGATSTYSLPVTIEKVQHDIGPGKWTTTYQMSPYVMPANVLDADEPVYDVLGNNSLAW